MGSGRLGSVKTILTYQVKASYITKKSFFFLNPSKHLSHQVDDVLCLFSSLEEPWATGRLDPDMLHNLNYSSEMSLHGEEDFDDEDDIEDDEDEEISVT